MKNSYSLQPTKLSLYKLVIFTLFVSSALGPNVRIERIFSTNYQLTFSQAMFLALGVALFLANRLRTNGTLAKLVFVLALHGGVASAYMGGLSLNFAVQLSLFAYGSAISYSLLRLFGLHDLLRIIAFISLIASISIIAEQMYALVSHPFKFGRVAGILREPSQASFVVVPGFYLLYRWKMWLGASLAATALLLTFSATTYVALLTSLLCISCSKSEKLNQGYKYFFVFLCFLVISLNAPHVGERLRSLQIIFELALDDNLNLNNVSSLGGSIGQLVISANVVLVSLQETFLWGVGFGDFRRAFPMAFDFENLASFGNLTAQSASGGNLILRLTAELGILGCVLLLIIVTKLLVLFWEVLASRKSVNNFPFLWFDAVCVFVIILSAYFARKSLYFDPVFLTSIVLGIVGFRRVSHYIKAERFRNG